MEPLESTSIHLIQSSIARLMSLFPTKNFESSNRDIFNRQTIFEYERIRDFLILHYKATARNDSDFWNYCRTMSVPETLTQKIDQFVETGNIMRENNELFSEISWLEVFHGQGIQPKDYHPLVDAMPQAELERRMRHIEKVYDTALAQMPTQEEFIRRYCQAT